MPHNLQEALPDCLDRMLGAQFVGRTLMLRDTSYMASSYELSEVTHRYGSNVHILKNPYLATILAKLCEPTSAQPLVNQLLNTLYRELVKVVVNQEFPTKEVSVKTRMIHLHKEAEFAFTGVDPNARVVSVNLARAGTVPSQICFDAFNYIVHPSGVRQDHISINRAVDKKDRVIGAQLGGVKIGGSIEDAYVIFPDPMGATGSTICTAVEIYKNQVEGKAKKFVGIHLVISPEYIRRVKTQHPDLIIYALRLDRGLSPKHVLASEPGEFWDEERGLDDHDYIVPGAGGMGEVINNSYV